MILEEMYNKQYILTYFKYELIKKENNMKAINYISGQLDLLNEILKQEIFEVLNILLKEKTNYRILKNIDKGHKNIVDILSNPEQWKLGFLKDNRENYNNEECLIFNTERYELIFGKSVNGQKYITNKWQ